jgi:hypothetical protein
MSWVLIVYMICTTGGPYCSAYQTDFTKHSTAIECLDAAKKILTLREPQLGHIMIGFKCEAR